MTFLSVRKKLDWEYFELNAKNQSYWVETVENVQEIKINDYEDIKRWKWEAIQARLYKWNLKVLKVNNTQSLGAQFINSMLNGPVAQLVGFIQSAQYAKISFMRINEIHQLKACILKTYHSNTPEMRH